MSSGPVERHYHRCMVELAEQFLDRLGVRLLSDQHRGSRMPLAARL
jgi:hypothetical protein